VVKLFRETCRETLFLQPILDSATKMDSFYHWQHQ